MSTLQEVQRLLTLAEFHVNARHPDRRLLMAVRDPSLQAVENRERLLPSSTPHESHCLKSLVLHQAKRLERLVAESLGQIRAAQFQICTMSLWISSQYLSGLGNYLVVVPHIEKSGSHYPAG